jgi:lysophospholipase L1-like esterase
VTIQLRQQHFPLNTVHKRQPESPTSDRVLTQGDVLSTRGKRGLMVLVTVAAIVLMLVSVEGAVRLRQMLKYGSATVAEEHYTVDRSINLRVAVPNYSTARISINSLGFRGPEIAVPKPPHTVRLAFLGASTTWCAEVSGNDFVWAHLVIQSLGRAFPGAQFDYVNGSLPGYTVSSLHKNLQYRIAPLKPDVIVIYEAANNLSGEMRELAEKQGIIAEAKMEQLSWPSRYSLFLNLVEKNLRVLDAQRAAQTNQGRLAVTAGTLGAEYRRELLELVLAAQKTAKLVAIATFSIHPRREQTPEQQLRALSSAIFYTPFVTPIGIIEGYERYNQIAREVAKETGAYLIEGAYDIPGDSVHFADTVHFTDAGSKAMAHRINRALVSNPTLRRILADNAAAR